jgi:hypothetical protein
MELINDIPRPLELHYANDDPPPPPFILNHGVITIERIDVGSMVKYPSLFSHRKMLELGDCWLMMWKKGKGEKAEASHVLVSEAKLATIYSDPMTPELIMKHAVMTFRNLMRWR